MSKLGSIQGLDKFQRQLEKLGKINHKRSLLAGAYKLQELSMQQKDLPVDTGFMRNSHNSDYYGLGSALFVNAEYAIYQHEGTKYIKARRWITKSIDSDGKQILQAVRDQEQEEIKGVV